MASKVFVDANFLLDITLNRPGAVSANAVMQAAIDGRIELLTSPAILHITSYYAAQHYSREQTRQIILTLMNHVKIIDCDHATALAALTSTIDDTEDALQYHTALKHGADYFISADKKLEKAAIPQLPVLTATALLSDPAVRIR